MNYKPIFRRLLEILTSNWKAKVFSLLLACLFYINLQNSKILIKNINIPIEYPKLESGLHYSKNPEKTFPVRVEGLREVVNYYSQFMKASVDVADLSVGDNLVTIKKISGVPNGIKVTKLKKEIEVTIEGSGTKQVALEASFDGELTSNFEKVSYLIRPNKITITGKQSDVDKISKIVLPPISLQDVNESFVKKVRIPDLPRGVRMASVVKEASVSVTISSQASKSGEQIIAGIPVRCIGSNQYLEPELSEEQVSIKITTKVPIKSSSIINGIQATVPCNYSYDPIRKKIIPSDQPVVTKIRVSRSRELKNIEILQILPDKVTITYRVKESLVSPLEPEDSEVNLEPEDPPPPPPDMVDPEGLNP
jgi:YbbR domain-containing protein